MDMDMNINAISTKGFGIYATNSIGSDRGGNAFLYFPLYLVTDKGYIKIATVEWATDAFILIALRTHWWLSHSTPPKI